jgi:hypothetical protein
MTAAKYTPEVGDIVVMIHPHMMDSHVVARIERKTPMKIGVRYLNRQGEFDMYEADRVRNADQIVGPIPKGQSPVDIRTALVAASEAKWQSDRDATANYLASVKTLIQETA